MNILTVIGFVLVITSSIGVLLYFYNRRRVQNRQQRLTRSLQTALQREVSWGEAAAARPRILRRAQ